jgi:hypothetical protein
MATANAATQELMDGRLDALDRALLGLLPRSERLKFVAEVEAKVRDGGVVSPEVMSTTDERTAAVPAVGTNRNRRSWLAITSGVVGIVALVLLFLLPITYLIVATIGEIVGELGAYVLLGLNFFLVALGGAAAVVMGITALIRLARRRTSQRGHGWAITGLCTGPLPMLVGGLAMIVVVVPMLGEVVSECSPRSGPAYASMPVSEPAHNGLVPVSAHAAPACAAAVPVSGNAAPTCAASACESRSDYVKLQPIGEPVPLRSSSSFTPNALPSTAPLSLPPPLSPASANEPLPASPAPAETPPETPPVLNSTY